MNNNKLTITELLFLLLLLSLPCIYMAYLYPHLPDIVPVHFERRRYT